MCKDETHVCQKYRRLLKAEIDHVCDGKGDPIHDAWMKHILEVERKLERRLDLNLMAETISPEMGL